jgi:hypothetical protein
MNKLIYFFALVGVFVLVACKSNGDSDPNAKKEDTVESLKERIVEIDDSLIVLFDKKMEDDKFVIDRLVYHEGINRCIYFYNTFPEDTYAPYALEKAAGLYDALRIGQKAADWRDTLINNYPDYDRMLFILEQQKAHYDNFDAYVPEKIRIYINKMLEFDDLSEEQREQLEFRLEHIDSKFMDIVRMRNPELDI